MTRNEGWWTQRTMPERGLVWRIGPLVLHIQRVAAEWLVSHREEEVPAEAAAWSVEPVAEDEVELDSFARFALGKASDIVRLTPRPADRSVVARPRAPLHVLAGEDARFYIGAPVWVEIGAGDPPRPLSDLPTQRLTDTWFGGSTRDGEVAYGLETHAHARLERLPRAAHRAITPVRIRNHGQDSLALDRMNLPVPYLSIYSDEEGTLWTEAVILVRGEDSEMATFEVGGGPPDEARGASLVGEPRMAAGGNPLVRAFGRLLRPFQEED